jgi:hypothetical protein
LVRLQMPARRWSINCKLRRADSMPSQRIQRGEAHGVGVASLIPTR